jgi:uncharacterized protein
LTTPPQYVDRAAASTTFVQKVFGWMFFGLLVTGGVAALMSNTLSEEFLSDTGMPFFIGALVLELIVVIALVAALNRISAELATAAFVFYAALNGFTFAFIFSWYTTESVYTAFFVTAGMFGAMAVVGWVTKVDLTKLGTVLIMALIGFLLATIVNIFLASDTLYWVTTYGLVVIFAGLTAYDIQKIKRYDPTGQDADTAHKGAIMGALALYLDFINLFLLFLRIFGSNR